MNSDNKKAIPVEFRYSYPFAFVPRAVALPVATFRLGGCGTAAVGLQPKATTAWLANKFKHVGVRESFDSFINIPAGQKRAGRYKQFAWH